MAKLPHHPEPDTLRSLDPDVATVPVGTKLYRIYRRGGEYPTRWNELRYFGPTAARFDHHLLDTDGEPRTSHRGIGYFSSNIPTAIAEVFQVDRTVDTQQREPWLVGFELGKDVTCLDLSGGFALRAGASMKLISGPRSHSRNWSRGFYDAYPNVEGVLYPSSLTNQTVYAFYERALEGSSPFPRLPIVHRALGDPTLDTALKNACRDIGYVIAPSMQKSVSR